ncbi:hypothetical protein FBUS_09933 [Fasciolopsis buskii]|uniref:Uncharacterized protein n=1 Tax=Fasciolopsis buskii TaxID=27845 RepID=A0A8E0RSB5_9TREM|nr:hypothetical protein FBUS_09933 [Fasciolopsis buski]
MEPTSQSKPRGHRRKHLKAPGENKAEMDTNVTNDFEFDSPGGTPTDSSGSEQEKERLDDAFTGRWEFKQTPPLEQSPQSSPKSMPEQKELRGSDPHDVGYEHMERRSKKPRRRKGERDEQSERASQLDQWKESETKNQATHVETGQIAREFEVHFEKEETSTKHTDPAYTPIHLPLSCEIYTPAYCVQATDRFDRLTNGEDYTNGLKQSNNTHDGKSPALKRIDYIMQTHMTDQKESRNKKRDAQENEATSDRKDIIEATEGITQTENANKIASKRKGKSEGRRRGRMPGRQRPKTIEKNEERAEEAGGGIEEKKKGIKSESAEVKLDTDVGADVSLPKADVSVKAPKFGFKFGKKAKVPKVEGPSLGGSATGSGQADLGVSVKGEAPRGGLKLKLPKFGWPKGSLKLGGDADVSGKVKVPEAGVHVSGPEIGGKIELPQAPGPKGPEHLGVAHPFQALPNHRSSQSPPRHNGPAENHGVRAEEGCESCHKPPGVDASVSLSRIWTRDQSFLHN